MPNEYARSKDIKIWMVSYAKNDLHIYTMLGENQAKSFHRNRKLIPTCTAILIDLVNSYIKKNTLHEALTIN